MRYKIRATKTFDGTPDRIEVISEPVHSKCGKKVKAVEVFAVIPQARYVMDEENGRFHETNVDESPESMTEEYVCQECGQTLTNEEVDQLQEWMADDDR